jgi:hypothetical protein
MLTNALLIEAASRRAARADAKKFAESAMSLRAKNRSLAEQLGQALSDELAALMR